MHRACGLTPSDAARARGPWSLAQTAEATFPARATADATFLHEDPDCWAEFGGLAVSSG